MLGVLMQLSSKSGSCIAPRMHVGLVHPGHFRPLGWGGRQIFVLDPCKNRYRIGPTRTHVAGNPAWGV
jgi:hypothetical protein